MTPLNERTVDAERHCAYCGQSVAIDGPVIERFGERFCSETHAEEFVTGVRSARIQDAARAESATPTACDLERPGQRTWKDTLKRGACWGGPLLLLLAIPLFWSGGAVATAGGSLLSGLALLACPLGMYFMMRGMTAMNHGGPNPQKTDNAIERTRR